MTIALIIIDTNVGGKGGAEKLLEKLLYHIDYAELTIDVIELYPCRGRLQTDLPRCDQLTIQRIPVKKLMSLQGLCCALKLYWLMRTKKYHCVMSFFEMSDILSAVIAPLAGIKHRVSNRRDTGFKHSTLMNRCYRLINGSFSKFVAVSGAVKETLLNQGVVEEKISIIYNGVDIEQFTPRDNNQLRSELNIPDKAFVVGSVANFNPVKDHETIIRALYQLHHDGQTMHLILAGEGQLKGQMVKLVTELGLQEYVHFLGKRDDVELLLGAVDIFVMASLTEGLSNALIEAMAVGKPVVVTSVGGNLDVVEEGIQGFLVGPGDVDGFEKAISLLKNDKALFKTMSVAGRKRVLEKFELSTMVGSYAEVFHATDLRERTLHR